MERDRDGLGPAGRPAHSPRSQDMEKGNNPSLTVREAHQGRPVTLGPTLSPPPPAEPLPGARRCLRR